jgi:hypothetical protein
LRKSWLRRIAHDLLWCAVPEAMQYEPYTSKLVGEKTGYAVRSGPFAGMKYLRKSYGSVLAPKLLGTYERELHKSLDCIISQPFQLIVDIGAAEGYYSVGLALKMPDTNIVAYEMNDSARELMKELAALNHLLDHLVIRGVCTIEELNSVLDPSVRALVICDAEGAEAVLLDPMRVPALKQAHILVELHDFILGGISQVIFSRFQATHQIEQIREEARSRTEFPFSTFFTRQFPSYVDFAISDCRPSGMSWLWMRPKP